MPFGGLLSVGLLGAGTSLFGGLLGSSAASTASQDQQKALQQLIQEIQQETSSGQAGVSGAAGQSNQQLAENVQQELGNLAPYLQGGQQGLGQLLAGLAPGGQFQQQSFQAPAPFQAPTAAQAAATPGEQFQLQQGEQAVDRGAAAAGGALSGGAIKAEQQYGQGLASTDYNNVYNQALQGYQSNFNNSLAGFGANQTSQTNSFNRLAALTGMGTTAASDANNALGQYSSLFSNNTLGGAENVAGLGMQGGQIEGNALAGIGNAQAAGTIGQANAWSGALGGASSSISQAAMLKALLGYGSPFNSGGYNQNPGNGYGGSPNPNLQYSANEPYGWAP